MLVLASPSVSINQYKTWTGEERHVTFIFLRLRNVKLMCIVHAQKLSLLFFRKHAFVSFCKTFEVNQQLYLKQTLLFSFLYRGVSIYWSFRA